MIKVLWKSKRLLHFSIFIIFSFLIASTQVVWAEDLVKDNSNNEFLIKEAKRRVTVLQNFEPLLKELKFGVTYKKTIQDLGNVWRNSMPNFYKFSDHVKSIGITGKNICDVHLQTQRDLNQAIDKEFKLINRWLLDKYEINHIYHRSKFQTLVFLNQLLSTYRNADDVLKNCHAFQSNEYKKLSENMIQALGAAVLKITGYPGLDSDQSILAQFTEHNNEFSRMHSVRGYYHTFINLTLFTTGISVISKIGYMFAGNILSNSLSARIGFNAAVGMGTYALIDKPSAKSFYEDQATIGQIKKMGQVEQKDSISELSPEEVHGFIGEMSISDTHPKLLLDVSNAINNSFLNSQRKKLKNLYDFEMFCLDQYGSIKKATIHYQQKIEELMVL